MEIIIVKSKQKNTLVEKFAIRTAMAVLKRGGVIAYPTETTYGLGCDPRNIKALEKIFKIKGRDKKKPLLLVASSIAQVRSIVQLPKNCRPNKRIVYPYRNRIIDYWPGPMTLVLPVCDQREETVPLPRFVAPHGEVAIRVSSSPFVQALCRAYGFPIVSTSANKTGEPECRSGKAVIRIFGKNLVSRSRRGNRISEPDLIIDAGSLPRRKPSTVARICSDGSIHVLRQGAVKLRSKI